ncbi:hypothetical protein [Candidatus Chlorohelix sp.]|uniref:hypothetical protein n=1 Tax=Candidatus Chlorohelix sp. TaxID=3139201 RepID=UPI00303EADFC
MSVNMRFQQSIPVPAFRPYPTLAWNIPIMVERYLPLVGEVVVAAGQRVDNDTPVARTLLPGRPRLFNLSEYFGMPPKEVNKLLLKKVSDRLSDGEIIAQKKGFRGMQFRAPFAATLSAYDEATGYLSLTPSPTPLVLEAFVRGIVSETVPGYGVKIETRANYLRGAVGFGGEVHGVLRSMVADPTHSVSPESIDSRSTYFILLAGAVVTAEVLRKAVEFRVKGVIAGSMREEEMTKFLDYRKRESFYQVGQNNWRFPAELNPLDCPFTLILTEGFGQRPMANRVFDMLSEQNGLQISINGITRLRRGWQRPEIIAVVGSEYTHPSTDISLEAQLPHVNSLVRLTNPTYLGVLGRVINLPQRRYVGANALDRMVEVEVGGGRRLMIPAVDMEVLEQY